jgi:Leucine-rich repeat (LRR) protein
MMSQWRLPHAQVIKLENNYIQGNVPIIFLSSLTELYLDGNDITELICLKERQLIPRLRIISIKNNKSKEIEVGNLEYNVPRSFHRALSGVWRSKIRPA